VRVTKDLSICPFSLILFPFIGEDRLTPYLPLPRWERVRVRVNPLLFLMFRLMLEYIKFVDFNTFAVAVYRHYDCYTDRHLGRGHRHDEHSEYLAG
jgi:hypothetical protein